MKITFVTGHEAEADLKTGFHFWAESLDKREVEVCFMTVGFSRISLLKNGRLYNPPYNEWIQVLDHVKKFVWFPLFHPMNFRIPVLNSVVGFFFKLYPFQLSHKAFDEITDTDIFIIESGAGLMLVPRLARLCPNAKFIYQYNDRLSTLDVPPVLFRAEKEAIRYFDLISCPALVLTNDFPKDAPTVYIPQAIEKTLFDKDHINPYEKPKNAISVGDMLFDSDLIEFLAQAFPDWTFHLFGEKAYLRQKFPNVIEYGVWPFESLIPYLVHADIGLAPYKKERDAEYLSQSSLKMVQYTYCRLPIVAPAFAAAGRDNVLSYNLEDDRTNVEKAFLDAISFDRTSIDRGTVMSWEEMLNKIIKILKG